MRVSCAILIATILSGCGPYPIRFERWGLSAVDQTTGRVLRDRIGTIEQELLGRCVSTDGLLLYRRLVTPDPANGVYLDLADQACWSGYLLAGLVFRQLCEPSDANHEQTLKVLGGLEFLESVTGVPGLIARCVAPVGIAERVAHHPEVWRAASVAGYRYRADVSKDQYAGLLFGLNVGASLSDDRAVRDRCRQYLIRCARHIIEGDLRIRDAEGEVTEFGDIRGRRFGLPIGVNSAIALSAIRAGQIYSDNAEFRATAAEHIESLLGSLEPLHVGLLGIRNYSNALMAAVGVASLVVSDRDPQHRRIYRRALRNFGDDFKGEGNGFFQSVLVLAGVSDSAEVALTLRNLLHAPVSVRIEELPEGLYDDLPRRLIPSRKWRPRSREALPLAVRPPTSFRWRSDPYLLDRKVGANGELQVSGVDLFCAYWFGRFSGWVPGPGLPR